jgi:polyhydroxyalkanoate synthase
MADENHETGMFANAPDAVAATEDVGGLTFSDLLEAGQRLALMPFAATTAAAQLWQEVLKIATGTSTVAPAPNDWRFRHPAWTKNPVYRSMAQLYLAWSDAATKMVEEAPETDWRTAERNRLALNILTSALSPTNYLFGNPEAIQRAFESGGLSLQRGLKQYAADLQARRSIPTQVDLSAFKVGENLACTPGSVIFRDDVCELIQYAPSTATVRTRPLVIVPPPIGKYYFLDLAPGKSFVEFAVSQGQQVYLLSWRNAGPEHAAWDMDTYGARVIHAVDIARDVSASDDVNILGFCAGGIILSATLNHLAAHGDTRVNSASFGVMLLDFDVPATIGAFSPATVLGAARRQSQTHGVLPAQDLATVFAWLRPNDLVWNYWVNNYLLGESPPAMDIMAWNADGTNLPAALHAQFLDIFQKNSMVRPGEVTVLGTPIDLSQITCDAYFMGAVNDHLTPWKSCYRSSQLFGGSRTFVLSNAGHIASLVNPPTNPKARHFTGPAPDVDADDWFAQATEHQGTWWQHWAGWIAERAGDERPAPGQQGNERYPVIEPAPGSYVHG